MDFTVKRNIALLSAGLACLFGMGQLTAAVASVTFVGVTGITGLLGLGPAIVLGSSSLSALLVGRAMDRFGRIPPIAVGFVVGALGTTLTGLGARWSSVVLVVLGFALIGAANGAVALARGAAGEMVPPERRARGIALVLFGALSGALLGPMVFSPLFANRDFSPAQLSVPWLAASAFPLVGLLLVLQVRPDPIVIARRYTTPAETGGSAAPLGEILRRPGVVPALLAAVASFSVMVTVMNMTGYVVVKHGHSHSDVFSIISSHFVGMFGFVLLTGRLIDRVGRTPAVLAGLCLVAGATVSLVWITSVAAIAAALFVLGLGWNLSYVAATAELVDLAAASERGRLLGFVDMCSAAFGATLAILGGLALGDSGVPALSLLTGAVALTPIAILAFRRIRYNPAPAGT